MDYKATFFQRNCPFIREEHGEMTGSLRSKVHVDIKWVMPPIAMGSGSSVCLQAPVEFTTGIRNYAAVYKYFRAATSGLMPSGDGVTITIANTAYTGTVWDNLLIRKGASWPLFYFPDLSTL